MEDQTHTLCAEILAKLDLCPIDKRLLIGICGVPGSGKTTLAGKLVGRLNRDLETPCAILVGMDGWHYTRAQLDAFDDPSEAHRRRGAAFTFDGIAFVAFLKALKSAATGEIVTAPSFQHETKDPVSDAITIGTNHRIVIIEGIYLAMNEEPWVSGAAYFDDIYLIAVDETLARARILERHVRTGVTPDLESAAERADKSDILNGQYMLSRLLPVTRTIQSIEDPVFRTASM